MKRFIATLALALLAATGTLGSVVAQDASPEASPVASPEASTGIPPIVWFSNDFLPTPSTAPSEEGAIALGSEYWIQFLPDGGFALRADCNGGFGSYELNGSSVSLSPLGTTLMLCPEGGQGNEFLAALTSVTSWSIDQNGASDMLILTTSDGTDLTFDPSLTGVVWQWTETQMSNDTVIIPNEPEKFQLSFSQDGSVVGVIDCNHAFGSYRTDGNSIVMMLATTKVFCGEDSQDTAYAFNLAQVTSYVIRDGHLALAMPMDAGIVIFEPVLNP